MKVSVLEVSEMVGMVFNRITVLENAILFFRDNADTIVMLHEQQCCENVYLESIVGDTQDLVDSPIIFAEESNNSDNTEDGSNTWTFYKFRTRKGYVDIRWYGESNGYYSEEAIVLAVKPDYVQKLLTGKE